MAGRRGRTDPRKKNGNARRKMLAWLRRQVELYDLPCHICGQPFDLSIPAGEPMSLTADEIIPVSRYKLGGYASAEACALDRNNVKPAHLKCNEARGNRLMATIKDPRNGFKVVNSATLPLSRDW